MFAPSISDDDLVSAPSWPDIAQQLQHHIGRRPLVIFNAEFDTRILKQTAAAHNDRASWLDSLTVYCAMRLAAGYYGPTNRYGTISLSGAVSQAGLSWAGEAHSAVTDAVMTARVVNNIAGYWREIQCEMNDGAGDNAALWLVRQLQVLIQESGMENMMKTMREHFPTRTVVIEQSLDMFGVKRNEDGTLLFPRHSDKRFPIARIRKRLAAYGWRGERLNKEVARIVAGPDIYAERNEYNIIFPYGWEKKQLTREMRRMFPRKTGRRVLIMLDELHHFSDLREKP